MTDLKEWRQRMGELIYAASFAEHYARGTRSTWGVGWSTKKRAEQAGEYASSVAYAFSLIETTP